MSATATSAEPAISEATRRHQGGDLAGAEDIYRRLLAASPEDADALRLLGALRFQRGDSGEAETLLRRAIAVAPGNAKAHDNYAFVLHGLGRDEEALAALRRAVELAPDNVGLQMNLANLLAQMKRLQDVVSVLQRIITLDPRNGGAHQMLGVQLLKMGDAVSARRHFDTCHKLGFINPTLLSNEVVACSETGDRDSERRLMDFDRLVVPASIGDRHGHTSLAEFNSALGSLVTGASTLHHDVTTVNGMDTGEYLAMNDPSVVALRGFVEQQIDTQRRNLPDPDHPFAKTAPEHWRIASWGVRMWREGYQVSHIHHAAWLSGVYYVQLPDVVHNGASSGNEGWIEFGRGRNDLYSKSQPEVRLIQPVEGLLLTFPSYMWHRTIPFESATERISIAFDVIPV